MSLRERRQSILKCFSGGAPSACRWVTSIMHSTTNFPLCVHRKNFMLGKLNKNCFHTCFFFFHWFVIVKQHHISGVFCSLLLMSCCGPPIAILLRLGNLYTKLLKFSKKNITNPNPMPKIEALFKKANVICVLGTCLRSKPERQWNNFRILRAFHCHLDRIGCQSHTSLESVVKILFPSFPSSRSWIGHWMVHLFAMQWLHGFYHIWLELWWFHKTCKVRAQIGYKIKVSYGSVWYYWFR